MLTVGIEAWGGVLERCEGLVFGETLGDVLCALRTNVVAEQAANESRIESSGGANSGKTGLGSVLECLEGLIDFETLRDVLGTLCTDIIVLQAANMSQMQTSEGADNRERDVRRRTRAPPMWNSS